MGLLAAIGVPTALGANDLVVVPNNELVHRGDAYARLARNGSYPEARRGIRVSLDHGAVSAIIYVSEAVSQAQLVVFSHGIQANPEVYAPLLKFLTTHGYCVIAPVHDDAQGIWAPSSDASAADALGVPFWERRVYECRMARDSYGVIANTLKITIDASRPVIIGHSHGAHTAQLLAGVTAETGQGAMRFSNDGWAGAILISPPGVGVLGLGEDSWSEVAVPLMVLSSKDERDVIAQEPERALDPYRLSAGTYRHLAYLSEGGASIYSGQGARPGTKAYYIFFDIRAALNSFLSAYALRDETVLKALYDGSIQERSYMFMSMVSR